MERSKDKFKSYLLAKDKIYTTIMEPIKEAF